MVGAAGKKHVSSHGHGCYGVKNRISLPTPGLCSDSPPLLDGVNPWATRVEPVKTRGQSEQRPGVGTGGISDEELRQASPTDGGSEQPAPQRA
eukprot:4209212-Prymnesium_polylepis.1